MELSEGLVAYATQRRSYPLASVLSAFSGPVTMKVTAAMPTGQKINHGALSCIEKVEWCLPKGKQ